jgi:hypothetical protein
MVLILQIYRVYEKKARRISCVFEKKKKGEELTKGGIETRYPLSFGRTAIGGSTGLLPLEGQR